MAQRCKPTAPPIIATGRRALGPHTAAGHRAPVRTCKGKAIYLPVKGRALAGTLLSDVANEAASGARRFTACEVTISHVRLWSNNAMSRLAIF